MILKEVCKKITDGSHNPPEGIEHGEYLMISSKNVFDDAITLDDPRYLSEEDYQRENKRTEVGEDDLLMTIVGTVGRVCVVPQGMKNICLQRSVAVLKPRQDLVLPRYLMYYLQSRRTSFEKEAHGVAQKGIYLKQLEKQEILVPPKSRQEQAISALDKVGSLICFRKQQLEKLDELVKARFVELFGNLVIGDKIDDNKKKIGDIASVTKLAGFEFTKYIQYKEYGDIIMLRGLNCKKGHLVLDDIKWIDKESSDLLPRSKLYYGDILMTYAGTIGDVAMVDADDKYHLAPNVAKITLNDKKAYNPVFLMHLFMYTNDYIMTFASVVAQASINMEKIRNFEYYFPPAELQNQFAAFVEQTDKSKVEIKKSLDELETLKKALMQKYFG